MGLYKSVIEKQANNHMDHNFKVLIVEDDDVAYLLLYEILASYPVQLIRACNGEDAIHQFQDSESPFDIVLMDIRMPVLNGFDATQKIKEINPSVPVIAITAYAHSQGIIDCFDAGCDDFIAKPFDIHQIIKIIEHYVVLK